MNYPRTLAAIEEEEQYTKDTSHIHSAEEAERREETYTPPDVRAQFSSGGKAQRKPVDHTVALQTCRRSQAGSCDILCERCLQHEGQPEIPVLYDESGFDCAGSKIYDETVPVDNAKLTQP